MRNIGLIFRREFAAYFATPPGLYLHCHLPDHGRNHDVLRRRVSGPGSGGPAALFRLSNPWLYLFLVPALSMRLWAEDRRLGTIELLLTLPITMVEAVIGKFLAAWAFTGVALVLTFPLWISVNYLGNPDNGVIVASYLGSYLMAGAYMAIGSLISAMTKNQVIAFVVTAAVCFLFTVAGSPILLNYFENWAPGELVHTIASFGFMTHFQAIQRGVIDLRDLIFFGSAIVIALTANAYVIDWKKAE